MKALLTSFVQDLQFAFRQSRKQVGFTLTVILLLALGIGGSTAAFSVFYQVLLKPLPYPNSQRLFFVHNFFPKSQMAATGVSGFDYAELSRRKDVFAAAGILFWNDLTLTGLGAARHLNVVNASSSLFEALAVAPQFGRIFSNAEDRLDAPRTTLLSDAMWRNDFNADPHVVGRTIYLNKTPYTVIGVMPRSFQFPSRETQLWIPSSLRPNEFTIQGGRLEKWLHMVARLAPGVTVDRARTALETITDRLAVSYPSFYPKKEGWQFTLRQVADEQTQTVRRWLYLAFGAVFSVLLIACINVSGLLLIRGTARSSEIAVRRAIGASKARIVWQILTETGLLAFVSCALGLVLAFWAVRLVNLFGPIAQPTSIHVQTLLFAVALGFFCTVVAGLTPALLSAQLPVEQTLKSGATRTATRGSGLRSLIVAAQLACAVGLLFTAAQLSRSFLNLTQVPTGFNQDHVWTGAVELQSSHYMADQSWDARFYEPLLAELRSIPGVRAASSCNAVPFNPNGTWLEQFHLPKRPPQNPRREAQVGLAFPGYFQAIGIPLLKGRTFTARDRAGAPLVAVIDQELAQRYFRTENPIGRLIGSGGEDRPATIIGVVGSVHNSDLGGPRVPEVYYPELQERTDATYLVLRTNSDLNPTAAVRNAIAKLDPDIALYDVAWMNDRVAASLKLRRFVVLLLNGLAVTGFLLATVGLYASIAHLVQMRQREIGIRMALGARQIQVARMILARATFIACGGVIGGVLTGVMVGEAVRAQLFGVTLTDPKTWIAVLGGILIASVAAASLPAWRASRVDPAVALRNE
ncbi:MAG: ABC transporter permease [Acidobacteriaceae bacterium]|nr:ABC transporter permease [Acidobacteriaceae bacterium]